MGDCNTEILVRIYWGIVDADFVVKMGSGGASALAYIADDVSAVYALASRHCVTGKTFHSAQRSGFPVDFCPGTQVFEAVGERTIQSGDGKRIPRARGRSAPGFCHRQRGR